MSDEERPILTKNWELLSTEDWNALDDDEYEDEQVEYLTLDFTQLSAGLTALEAFKQYQLIVRCPSFHASNFAHKFAVRSTGIRNGDALL